MDLNAAYILSEQRIRTGQTHQDYKRVCALATLYEQLITGENIRSLLRRCNRREDEEMFKQREELTEVITPAVAASVETPFNKVGKLDKVVRKVDTGNEATNKVIQSMIDGFYGDPAESEVGLDYWLRNRFRELSFKDPNAWVIAEWDAPTTQSAAVNVRPFEVSCYEAVDFVIQNEAVKWLFVKRTIDMPKKGANPGEIEYEKGIQYSLYDQDVTVVYQQINVEYFKDFGQLMPGQEVIQVKSDSSKTFLRWSGTPKLGYPPTFRIGYCTDQATNSRTYVNPFHKGMAFFKKSIKTVSELDLTMTLHAFPQKIQYVQLCPGNLVTAPGGDGGEKKKTFKPCKNGRHHDGTMCNACKGSGYKMHTSAQDAMLLPMPENGQDMIDLNNTLVYKAPPIELIDFQNRYVQQLKEEVHLAVFNSDVFVQKKSNSSSVGGGAIEQTATAREQDMDSAYDALSPYGDKYSSMWKRFVKVFVKIAGANPATTTIIHMFPKDLKLKTIGMLLDELAAINASKAPSFLRDQVTSDIANLVFAGDDLGKLKNEVRRRFFPFNGKTEDEILVLIASPFVSRYQKILYSNYESIFSQIDRETPTFWLLKDYNAQYEIVKEVTQEYIDEIDNEQPEMPRLNGAAPGAPGSDPNATGGAGGSTSGQQDNSGGKPSGNSQQDDPGGQDTGDTQKAAA